MYLPLLHLRGPRLHDDATLASFGCSFSGPFRVSVFWSRELRGKKTDSVHEFGFYWFCQCFFSSILQKTLVKPLFPKKIMLFKPCGWDHDIHGNHWLYQCFSAQSQHRYPVLNPVSLTSLEASQGEKTAQTSTMMDAWPMNPSDS